MKMQTMNRGCESTSIFRRNYAVFNFLGIKCVSAVNVESVLTRFKQICKFLMGDLVIYTTNLLSKLNKILEIFTSNWTFQNGNFYQNKRIRYDAILCCVVVYIMKSSDLYLTLNQTTYLLFNCNLYLYYSNE